MITNTVDVNGMQMSYFSFGSGEKTMVILPGIDTKSILLSSKAVEAAYRPFAEGYTVYCFDRRKNMPNDYSVRQMAADTALAMQSLGIEDACVFGASQGGMIAMCIAADYPHLISKLVLGSTAAKADTEIVNGVGNWIKLAENADMPALTANFIDNLYSPDTIGKYKEMLLHLNDNVTAEDIRRFIIQAKAVYGYDISAELSKVRCKALVIGSKGDKIMPPHCSYELADLLQAELYMYGTEFGHCVFDEAPDYKNRIFAFFNS